ncbi:type II secretion system F family protein [Patescibacteria group bacterium]|nr:type II secretion system F family protein [Patescibacteria group bacterium]
MKFVYQARSKEGKIEKGTVNASSKEAAVAILQKYDVFVTSLKEEKTPLIFLKGRFFKKKASKKDLAVFSRQLAVMINARVPVVQSLRILAAQTVKSDFREAIIKVSELIEEGNSLSEAFSSLPDVFDVFYANLIKSGEASGRISESLDYLSNHLEREYDITAKIKGAMIYPVVILSALLVVFVIVMTVVMPKLIIILKEMGGEIPLTTKILIGFYDFFTRYGWVMSIAFVGFIAFLIYYLRTQKGKKVFDRMVIKTPFINEFFKKTYLASFAENLSTLITAGLPVNRALKITKDTINNSVYREIINEVEEGVSEGAKISSILIKYPECVPAFVIQMIRVGEETGNLNKTLMEVVNFYQKEITRIVDNFMTIIEPILILVLGLGVALLAVSVLSPMYGMLGSV